MKKQLKKLVSTLLAVILVMGTAVMTPIADVVGTSITVDAAYEGYTAWTGTGIDANGNETNVTCYWKIDNGKLLVAGTIPNSTFGGDVPWHASGYRNSITEVYVEPGTKASSKMGYSFADLTKATSMDLSNLDTSNTTDMSTTFYCSSSLKSLDLSGWDTSKVTNMSSMFYQCKSLETLVLRDWNTSNVKYMNYMFYMCTALKELDLSSFDTSNVTTMERMFCMSKALTTIDVSSFDTSKVEDMKEMFYYCGFKTLDLNSFDTSSVKNMSWMFGSCQNLETIYVGDGWNTASVTNSTDMFRLCTEKLVGGQGTVWNSSKIDGTYAHIDGGTSNPGYFTQGLVKTYTVTWQNYDGTVLETDEDVEKGATPEYNGATPTKQGNAQYKYIFSGWSPEVTAVTGDVTYTAQFTETDRYDGYNKWTGTGIDANGNETNVTCYWKIDNGKLFVAGTIPNTNKSSSNIPWYNSKNDITEVYVEEGTKTSADASYLFYNLANATSIDVSNLDTGKTTNMVGMFNSCRNVTSLNLSNFDTSKVTSMSGMFNGCMNLTTLDLSSFNTSNVTIMSNMFLSCTNLTSLNLNSFNTSNVTNMGNMFNGCGNLTTLDLSSFNTSNVENMSGMFNGCENLTTLDLSSFNTSNVTSMTSMFQKCKSLTTLDLSGFNTQKVTSMSNMFYGCENLTTLDLSGFNTQKVNYMGNMFYGCEELTTIYVGNDWNTGTVPSSDGMFSDCKKLVGGQGTIFDSSKTDKTYAHIDGGTDNPGYLTSTVASIDYTVVWKDADGTVLETDENVAENATPSYDGATPTKAADNDYTYTFSGWTDGTNNYSLTDTLPPVTADITYTATFTANQKSKITVVDVEDGSLSADKTSAAENETVTVTAVPDDGYKTNQVGMYVKTASNVTPTLTALSGDSSHNNEGHENLVDNNIYTKWYTRFDLFPDGPHVIFKAASPTIMKSYSLTTGNLSASYPGRNWKDYTIYGANFASDSEATKNSAEWKVVVSVTDDTVLQDIQRTTYNFTVANPSTIPYQYYMIVVTANKGDKSGGVGGIQMSEFKMTGDTYRYQALTPSDTDATKYPFSMPDADVIVDASYDEIPKYTVTWKNADGTTLETDENVAENTTPSYDGATPTKQGNAQYRYIFSGWSPEVTVVTGDVTYTATFTSTVNQYTVTFNSNGGSTVDAQTVAYGSTASVPAEPTKEGYNFTGWYNGETAFDFTTAITENITLTAGWEDTKNYIDKGKHLWYTFDETNGALVIYGDGNAATMARFFYDGGGKALNKKIKTVTFDASANVSGANSSFRGCSNLTTVEGKLPSGTIQTMFYGCTSLESVPAIPTNASNTSNMFKDCTKLTSIGDDNNITLRANMINGMFEGCKALSANITIDNRFTTVSEELGTAHINGIFTGAATEDGTKIIVCFGSLIKHNNQYAMENIKAQMGGNVQLHDMSNYVDDGNGTTHSHICSRCGEKETENHTFDNGVCTVCGALEDYFITVTNGIITKGEKEIYHVGDIVTLKADAPEEGKVFAYWEDGNGNKLSTKANYSFVVLKSVDLTAVYNDNYVAEEILNISAVQTSSNGKNAIRFVFNRSVDTKAEVEEVGLIYATNKLAGYTSGAKVNLTELEGFDIETVLKENTSGTVKTYKSTSTSINGTIRFTYTIGNNTDSYVYAYGYVKLADGTTVYTDLLATTYNSIG